MFEFTKTCVAYQASGKLSQGRFYYNYGYTDYLESTILLLNQSWQWNYCYPDIVLATPEDKLLPHFRGFHPLHRSQILLKNTYNSIIAGPESACMCEPNSLKDCRSKGINELHN